MTERPIRSDADGRPDVLAITGLSVHFDVPARGRSARLHALDDVDLRLHKGSVLAVVGESGSGKSTIVRTVCLVNRPTAGRVVVGGQDASALSSAGLRTYRRQVQMVFQDPFGSINPAHRVAYPIDRALRLHTGLRGAALVARRRELLEAVELSPAEEFETRFPHELSGGQRQRVSIAAAIAGGPDLLLADEPVSMLDVSIRAGVLRLLDRLRRELGLSILLVTHDLASAQMLADETLVLYAGHVMEVAPTHELLRRPLHPYTQLLLASIPDPRRQAARLVPRGEVPDLVTPPPGCRFADRCPLAQPVCHDTVPEVQDAGGGHHVRCHAFAPATSSLFAAPSARVPSETRK